MSKNYLFILLFLISGSGFSQDYSLNLQITNSPSFEFYLADFYGDKNTILDTVQADTSGMASFSLTGHPSGMYRVFLNQQAYFDFIFNQENVRIRSDYNDLYESLVVEESLENQIYYEYLRTRHEYRRKFELLTPLNDYYPRSDSFFHIARGQYIAEQAEMQVYINDMIEVYPDAWACRILKAQRPLFYDPSMDEPARRAHTIEHYFDNFDFNDLELIRSNVYTSAAIQYMSLYSNPNMNQEQLENEFIKAVDKIMYEAMDNNLIYEFIVAYLVGGFEQYHFDKVLDYIAENYSPEQCENEARKTDLQTRLEKYAELGIGKKAPEIELTERNKESLRLSKIKANYTLLIFWASWCPHCNTMLPEIQNLYTSSIDERKLKIVALSLDTDESEWHAALTANPNTWINASDLKGWDSQAAIDYNVYATPSMYLLDKEKNIVAKPITLDELKRALMEVNLLQ